jgi:hypothetical protein
MTGGGNMVEDQMYPWYLFNNLRCLLRNVPTIDMTSQRDFAKFVGDGEDIFMSLCWSAVCPLIQGNLNAQLEINIDGRDTISTHLITPTSSFSVDNYSLSDQGAS